jgi:hypothetical protein
LVDERYFHTLFPLAKKRICNEFRSTEAVWVEVLSSPLPIRRKREQSAATLKPAKNVSLSKSYGYKTTDYAMKFADFDLGPAFQQPNSFLNLGCIDFDPINFD